jgi:hypothetical protein
MGGGDRGVQPLARHFPTVAGPVMSAIQFLLRASAVVGLVLGFWYGLVASGLILAIVAAT